MNNSLLVTRTVYGIRYLPVFYFRYDYCIKVSVSEKNATLSDFLLWTKRSVTLVLWVLVKENKTLCFYCFYSFSIETLDIIWYIEYRSFFIDTNIVSVILTDTQPYLWHIKLSILNCFFELLILIVNSCTVMLLE